MKQKLVFNITATLWKWHGTGAWYFIYVDKKQSEEIRSLYGKGLIPVSVTVGKTTWNTSLLPHLESNMYLVAVKKQVRRLEQLVEDDVVNAVCKIQISRKSSIKPKFK